MSENTKIEWADHTFNAWIGCTKVSPGCDHCYAEAWDRRFAGSRHAAHWGTSAARTRTSDVNWKLPLKWNAQAQAEGRRFRVFCASLADVFDNAVDPEWREDLFALIRHTTHLDWLLLTKRIGNAASMIEAAIADFDIGYDPAFALWPWPNVWLGATVVNQEEADRDIPKLLAVPARVRFLSIEPMLGPLRLDEHGLHGGPGQVDWVICGGESGRNARPMHPEWAASLRNQCAAAGVPYFFKQWGEWMPEAAMNHAMRMRDCGQFETLHVKLDGRTHSNAPDDHEPYDASDVRMVKVGKKAAGRLLDGAELSDFPRGC